MAGGVGEAKTGGNYAASLYVGEEARRRGYSSPVARWPERRYVEMNICFVYRIGASSRPLTGTILPGVTRKSVLSWAANSGYEVPRSGSMFTRCSDDICHGRITEVFGCTGSGDRPGGQVRLPR